MKIRIARPSCIILLLLVILFSDFTGLHAETSVSLTVIHSNDFHGASMKLLAVRAALIKKIRAESENPLLLLDAGDVFTRGPYAKTFKGELEFAVFNKLRYDALTLGNNEFKYGWDVLKSRVEQAEFSVLAANVKNGEGKYLPGVQPFVIKDYNGFRLAVFGITTLKPVSYKEAQGMQFLNPMMAARETMNALDGKADAVLALTHIGLKDDRSLAKSVLGITAIIGGDSHTATLVPVKENGVPIVQAGSNGRYLGRLDLMFNKNADGRWELKKYKGRLYDLWESDLKQDAEIRALIEEYTRLSRRKAS